MATELNSYELNGVKESIADWISNISPREFVYQSIIGKGSTTQPKFEWQVDYDEAVDPANALMEGFEFSELDDGFIPTTVLTGYTQKMGKSVKVTGDADAQSAWGRGKESNYQATKKARALKRDLEYALLNNGASVAEVKGDTPRMLGGFQSLVSSIDGGATITEDPLSGTTTFIEAAGDQPTSEEILGLMAALWETGGVPEVLMCSNTMSGIISGMQEEGNKNRIFENTEKITYEVNTITDPLGQTVKVVFNRHMPADTVYIFNPDDWQIIMFRAPQTELQGKSGDYIRSVLHMDVGQRHRNPWASGVLAPKQTPAAVLSDAGAVQVSTDGGDTWDTTFPDGFLVAGSPVDFTARIDPDSLDESDDGSYEYDFIMETSGAGGLSLINTSRDIAHITGTTPADQAGLTLTVNCTVKDKAGNTADATAVSGDWGDPDLLDTLNAVDDAGSGKKSRKKTD